MALAEEVAPAVPCRLYYPGADAPEVVHATGWGCPIEPGDELAVRLSDGRLMPL